MLKRAVGALSVAMVSALLLAGLGPAAVADKRSEAVEQRQAAQEQLETLRHELEGLSSDLAEVYIELEKVNLEIPVVESELASAREQAAAAERAHQQVADQLAVAQSDYDSMVEKMSQSEEAAAELQESIASMARDLYRGGETSALSLVLTSSGPGDITERIVSAETFTRAQSRALEATREEVAALGNQSLEQEAMAERIAGLEREAQVALEQAQATEASVAAKSAELKEMQASLQSKEEAWEARKSEAVAQIEAQENAVSKADEIIAKVDEENRKAEEERQRLAQEQAERDLAAGIPSSPPPASSSGTFGWPAPAGTPITSSFGYRLHPILGIWRLHDGTDFGLGCGEAQYAVADGTVVGSYFDSGGGNMVIINHGMINGDSWTSQHLHLQSPGLPTGTSVSKGQIIGYTGTTGNSTGCHLHFTLQQNGTPVNPMDFLS